MGRSLILMKPCGFSEMLDSVKERFQVCVNAEGGCFVKVVRKYEAVAFQIKIITPVS
jgi:hypothetical protein